MYCIYIYIIIHVWQIWHLGSQAIEGYPEWQVIKKNGKIMIPKMRDSSNGFHLGSQHFKTPQDSARCLKFSPVSCKRNSWGSHSPDEKSSQFLHIGICRDIPHTRKSNRNGAKLDSTKTVHLSSLVVSNWGMPKKQLNLNQENIDRKCGDIKLIIPHIEIKQDFYTSTILDGLRTEMIVLAAELVNIL